MATFESQVADLYIKQNKSTYEIAEMLKTYPNKIVRALRKMGYTLRTRAESQKLAIDSERVTHPTKGKERSYEEKLKISAKVSKHWEKMSDEDRENRVGAAKVRWEALPDSKKKEMSDLSSEAIRKASKEGSKFEKFLQDKLTAHYSIEFHKKCLIQNHNLEIDIYVPQLKTAIEVDGPSHFLPMWGEAKLQKQTKADLDKNGLLLSNGYVIIRLKVLRSLCISAMEETAQKLISMLDEINNNFPPPTKRYIEVNV